MATFALSQPQYLASSDTRPALVLGGDTNDTTHPWLVEAASQTYKAGQLVYWDTSGNVAICTQSSSVMTSAILGQALIDGQNGSVGVPKTRVRVIRPEDKYIMNVYHSTAGSALTNRNQLTDVFGLIMVNPSTLAIGTAATDVWCVDLINTTTEDATTNSARVRVVGFPDKHQGIFTTSTLGDTYGPVIVQFLPFSIATDGSPFTRTLQFA